MIIIMIMMTMIIIMVMIIIVIPMMIIKENENYPSRRGMGGGIPQIPFSKKRGVLSTKPLCDDIFQPEYQRSGHICLFMSLYVEPFFCAFPDCCLQLFLSTLIAREPISQLKTVLSFQRLSWKVSTGNLFTPLLQTVALKYWTTRLPVNYDE